jgi:hypothetical protein
LPDEPHETVLPCESVIVIVVLLKVAATCAIPSASTMRLLFFPVAMVLLGNLLLAGYGATWTLFGARVGVCSLTPYRQTAAVPQSPVRSDVHQSLDVHGNFSAEGTFYSVILFDQLPETVYICIAEIFHSKSGVYATLLHNFAGYGATDAKDVGKANFNLFFSWQIYAGNSRHLLTLPLLVLGISGADDASYAATFYNLAMFTDGFYAASDLHSCSMCWEASSFFGQDTYFRLLRLSNQA